MGLRSHIRIKTSEVIVERPSIGWTSFSFQTLKWSWHSSWSCLNGSGRCEIVKSSITVMIMIMIIMSSLISRMYSSSRAQFCFHFCHHSIKLGSVFRRKIIRVEVFWVEVHWSIMSVVWSSHSVSYTHLTLPTKA